MVTGRTDSNRSMSGIVQNRRTDSDRSMCPESSGIVDSNCRVRNPPCTLPAAAIFLSSPPLLVVIGTSLDTSPTPPVADVATLKRWNLRQVSTLICRHGRRHRSTQLHSPLQKNCQSAPPLRKWTRKGPSRSAAHIWRGGSQDAGIYLFILLFFFLVKQLFPFNFQDLRGEHRAVYWF